METNETLILQQMMHQTPRKNVISATQQQCPQCGLLHPPLPHGERCPNAPLTKKLEKDPTTEFIIALKNILLSQIEKKKIQNVNKVLQLTLVELTKFLESYKE